MKKQYEKPSVEEIEFLIDEELLGPLDGDMGVVSSEDDWE